MNADRVPTRVGGRRTTRRSLIRTGAWTAPAVSLAIAAPAAAATSADPSPAPSLGVVTSEYYIHPGFPGPIIYPVVTLTNASTVTLTLLAVELVFQVGRFTGYLPNPNGGAPLPGQRQFRDGLNDGWSMDSLTDSAPAANHDPNAVTVVFRKDALAAGATTSIGNRSATGGALLTWKNIDEGRIPGGAWANEIPGLTAIYLPEIGYFN